MANEPQAPTAPLTVGQKVHCPADRGYDAYDGTVISVSADDVDVHGKPFQWVGVEAGGRDEPAWRSCWPSHRLLLA